MFKISRKKMKTPQNVVALVFYSKLNAQMRGVAPAHKATVHRTNLSQCENALHNRVLLPEYCSVTQLH